MRTTKRLLCMLIALVMVFTLGVAAFASSEEAADGDVYASLSLEGAAWTLDEQNGVWSLTGLTYCLDPVSDLEYLNIFVPEDYMDEDGQFTDAVINGYDADTAPVILANDVGGYTQSNPISAGSAAQYTSRGYVVVSAGTRGRDTVNEDGEYIGISCASLTDLKAAVRFIKYNEANIPGNADHIVSIGKSAGGGLSVLLATTGNNAAYDSYLQDIGAIMTETDDIYAAQVYCPGTDAEHENLSYEWFYHDSLSYDADTLPGPSAASSEPGVLNEYQQALSDDLALLFVDYLNSLDLTDENGDALTLDGLREGSYYDYFMGMLESSLEDYLAETYPASEDAASLDEDAINAYMDELNAESEWVTAEFTYDGDQAVAVSVAMTSLADYTNYYWTRPTSTPAYDETNYADEFYPALFGEEDGTMVHYDPYLAELMTSGKYEGLEGYDSSYTEDYLNFTTKDTSLMNPITMMDGSDIASYVRIRTGTQDSFSTYAGCLDLALMIECNSDAEVDMAFAWGQPHGEAEINSEDLFTWIDLVCGADA